MSEVKRFRADHRHVVETEFDDAQFVGVADFDRATAERDAALGLSVAKIMLDIVPGYDGMGEEVYAKSVEDVEHAFTKLYDEVERLTDQRDALQQRLTAADERADVLETALRELLSGTGSSPGANKKYGKARAVLESLHKKAESRICSPANPHNYHLGECTKCGAISPTE